MEISFILPCYNVEKYVEDCIKSIENQGLTENEYEIICVDDCSTDNTYSVLEELSKTIKSIKIIKNKKNSGVSFSRNRGIESASGKWLWFVDSDDFLCPDVVKKFIVEGNENNADMVVGLFTEVPMGYKIGEEYNSAIPDNLAKKETGKGINQLPFSVSGSIGASMCCSITKRNVFLDNNVYFNENIAMCEDGMMQWELEQLDLTISRIPCVCYLYRYNPDSSSHFISEEKRKRYYFSEIERISVYNKYKNCEKCKNIEKTNRLINQAIKSAIDSLMRISDKKFVKEQIKYLEEQKLYPIKSTQKIKRIYKSKLVFSLNHFLYNGIYKRIKKQK